MRHVTCESLRDDEGRRSMGGVATAATAGIEAAPTDDFASLRLHLPPVEVPERVHDDHHVLLWQVRGGGTDLLLDDVAAFLPVGHALWVPAEVRHALTVRANSVVIPLFFDCDATATTLRAPTIVAVGRELRTLLLAYLQSTTSIIRPHANITRQLFALLEGAPAAALPLPASAPARLVAETLRANPGDDRPVDDLAHAAHTSRRTLERAFLAETGMSVRDWRIRNRVEAAAALLRSHAAVPAVARRVGYTNVNAFRRVFKSRFGMTPTAYATRYAIQK
ncbi:helix-turn-helix domain-containing protein [Microbacterium sp.]|uniref:AraC family transcriptional regulator n=1 Tax=Microbacterium sp. TaxID=51671 RepID=UPI0039E64BC3